MRTTRVGPQVRRSGDSKSTNRAQGQDFCEVIPDGIHRGLDRRFKKPFDLCPVDERRCKWKLMGGGVNSGYPVSDTFPALIPCAGSLSLGEPNLTNRAPFSSENTLFKPSSNLWAKFAISSGVSNFECFNFSGGGLMGVAVDGQRVIAPETMSFALAVMNSPPCSRPSRSVSVI